jgi:FG-GAP-like repeat
MPRVSRPLVALALTAVAWSAADSLHSHSLRTQVLLPSQGAVLASVHSAGPVVLVDIDHDGDGDLVVLSARGELRLWRNDGTGHFVQASGAQLSLRLASAPHALSRASAARPSIDTSLDSPAVVSFGAAGIGPVQKRAGPAADRPRRLPKPALPSFGPPRAPPLRFV